MIVARLSRLVAAMRSSRSESSTEAPASLTEARSPLSMTQVCLRVGMPSATEAAVWACAAVSTTRALAPESATIHSTWSAELVS